MVAACCFRLGYITLCSWGLVMPLGVAEKGSTITAVLGPTNTGKTHRAVQRMLEHRSGMIGLPLRLLAREIYDRITPQLGESQVALVTGEEKRVPTRPRYWVCTVESMPLDRVVDFLAVDEVQLAAHNQRGHAFTDRLLHARGREETWFMGSDTMRPLVQQLVPTATIRSHPRLSTLKLAAPQGLGALPPRTAVIAFSAPMVYQLADRLRRRRGGAAVVLGALSPRARNAQVAMYQAGEVQYLVATDAVGMGLNMDVDHVAFAELHKFDGRRTRALWPAELGQIAGRAGRHTSDGTFGVVAPLELSPAVGFAIETHRFANVRRAVWRSTDLELSSLDELVASLKARPTRSCLTLVERADDFAALLHLAAQPEIRARANHAAAVALLWDVCRIPDFRKLMVEHHAHLLGEIFMQLSGASGRLHPDWLDERVGRLERIDGDIEELMMRMEGIRTWNFVAHHAAWVDDATHWQQRTEAAEDQLSNALHERLTARFVDATARGTKRRSKARSRRQPPAADLGADSNRASNPFAVLQQLKSELAVQASGQAPVVDGWLEDVIAASHEAFRIDEKAGLWYDQTCLAQLTRGVDLLHPEIKLQLERATGAGARSRLMRRLTAFSRDLVQLAVEPLRDARAGTLSPPGRGLIYQLEQALGTVTVKQARGQLRDLTDADRELLSELDVHVGYRYIFVPSLLFSRAVQVRTALCAAYYGRNRKVPTIAPDARSTPKQPGVDDGVYLMLGYPVLGPCAVRADVAEQVNGRLHKALRAGPGQLPAEFSAELGCSDQQATKVALALGFRRNSEGLYARRSNRRRRRARPKGQKTRP